VYFQNLRRRKPTRKAVVTRADNPLLSLKDAEGFLRNLNPADNNFINNTILAVQRNVEAYANIRIDSGTFDAWFEGGANELDVNDLPATVTGIYAIGVDGSETLLTSGSSYVMYQGSSPIIRLLYDNVFWQEWFNFYTIRPESLAFRVRYAGGYADLSQVWPQVRLAMEHEVAWYYKNRQDGDQQAVVLSGELTMQAKAMLDPIKKRQ
jgi:hypothetical protein